MRLLPSFILNIVIGCSFSFAASAQNSAIVDEKPGQIEMAGSISKRFIHKASSRAEKINKKLVRKSQKALKNYQRLEGELFQQISLIDTLEAIRLFNGSKKYFDQLSRKLDNPAQIGRYVPEWDTLVTAMKFVSGDRIQKIDELTNSFNKAELIL